MAELDGYEWNRMGIKRANMPTNIDIRRQVSQDEIKAWNQFLEKKRRELWRIAK